MRIMDYQAAIKYLYDLTDYEKIPGSSWVNDFDLRRMEELLSRLGNPHQGTKSVHVAGTKGKGSTSVMIASVLGVAGYRVGLYTSPHLYTPRERIRIGNSLISEVEFGTLMDEVIPEVETVNNGNRYGKLTTFEVFTALAFLYFRRAGVDFQVLEVGLGGRLDATNVINADVSVITTISLDHMDILGNNLVDIAAEKAGIIKPGNVVVSSVQYPEAMMVIAAVCRQRNAALIKIGKDVTWQGGSSNFSGQSFILKGIRDGYCLTIPLLGDHQIENAAAAVTAIECLINQGNRILKEQILSGMAGVQWPGRLQILRTNPVLIVDGAHNADSCRRLKEAIIKYFKYEHLILIVGTSVDKDITGIAEELCTLADIIIVTRSQHPRSAGTDVLLGKFTCKNNKTYVARDVATALETAYLLADKNDLICATGSLFIIAEVSAACL